MAKDQGTMACPMCGISRPHQHTTLEHQARHRLDAALKWLLLRGEHFSFCEFTRPSSLAPPNNRCTCGGRHALAAITGEACLACGAPWETCRAETMGEFNPRAHPCPGAPPSAPPAVEEPRREDPAICTCPDGAEGHSRCHAPSCLCRYQPPAHPKET